MKQQQLTSALQGMGKNRLLKFDGTFLQEGGNTTSPARAFTFLRAALAGACPSAGFDLDETASPFAKFITQKVQGNWQRMESRQF